MHPQPAASSYELVPGILALPGGFALLTASRTLLCADAHLGYEDAMGGGAALPLWSTTETVSAIALAARQFAAQEIVFLGDAIHSSTMSDGAARSVREALDLLRRDARLTIIAGNHEGRSRGVAILGATVDACERDGWSLVHGDRPTLGMRTIIGHLHPSIHLGGRATAPAFLAGTMLVVVPALTPYSPGLDVMGDACRDAIGAWGAARSDVHVVAATAERVYPFGTLSRLVGLRSLDAATSGPRSNLRRRLSPDARSTEGENPR
jgi:metallophosphoesterase superfamily enzyme